MTDNDSNSNDNKKTQDDTQSSQDRAKASTETQRQNNPSSGQHPKSGNPDKTAVEAKPAQPANENKNGNGPETPQGAPPSARTKDKDHKPKPSAKAAEHTKPKRRFPFVAVLALIVGAAAGGAAYINYTHGRMSDLQRRSLASENTKLLDQLETLQQQVSTLQQQGQAFKSNAEQLSSNLSLQNDSVKQLSQQLQALSAEQGRDPLLWRVAEVEYLLSVANNRLQLERDSKTALVALQDADRRLETLGDPALIPIRKTIAGEIIALNSVETPDITGMAVRLSSLVDGIETLPLVSRERLKTAETQSDSQLVNSFSQFWANLLKDLKSVVTIRRSGEPIEPLLPPDEQYYLSQNLGLKLQEARLALLRRETGAFRQDLSDTRQWVEQFFDKESASVGNVISTLDAMETVNLKPDLPDISGSLRQLRHWMALQQQSKKSSAPAGIPNEEKG